MTRLHSPDDRHAAVVAAYDFSAPLVVDVVLHGRERTPAEFTDLLTKAGFGQPRIVRTASPLFILEATSA